MKTVVILTGAGISAESGVPTFRDANGLWEGHDIMEVASPVGWEQNPELVLDFYNKRRRALRDVEPNRAHQALVELEEQYEVHIITQNVDDLHERAGSSNILHLHGEITKARSTNHSPRLYHIGYDDLCVGDTCEEGSQLRPHVVWFGEGVPTIEPAAQLCAQADFFLVIGTSMAVYPAAGLIEYVPDEAQKWVIDRSLPPVGSYLNLHKVEERASVGVPKLVAKLLAKPGAE